MLEFDHKKLDLPKSVHHHFDRVKTLQEKYFKYKDKCRLKEIVFTKSDTISGELFVKSLRVNKGVKLVVNGDLNLFSETDVIVDGKIETKQKINNYGKVQKGDVVIKSLGKIKIPDSKRLGGMQSIAI